MRLTKLLSEERGGKLLSRRRLCAKVMKEHGGGLDHFDYWCKMILLCFSEGKSQVLPLLNIFVRSEVSSMRQGFIKTQRERVSQWADHLRSSTYSRLRLFIRMHASIAGDGSLTCPYPPST